MGLLPERQMRMQKTNTELTIWNGRMGEGFGKGQGDVDLAEREGM